MGVPDSWMGPREEAILDLFIQNNQPPADTAHLRPMDCWGHNPTHTNCGLIRGTTCYLEAQCRAAPDTAIGLCREHYSEIFGEREA